MKENPPDAYSQLGMILARENVSVLALQRKLAAAGVPVNVKSLYRLAEDAPLQKIDLRIAAAICRTLDIALDDLISLDKPKAQLRRLDAKRQARLDALMDKNNEGRLTTLERKEFVALADMAHRISIENARTLLTERRRAGKVIAVAKKGASQKRTPIAA
jgi:DNA-binding Xre family transcriptional regulator